MTGRYANRGKEAIAGCLSMVIAKYAYDYCQHITVPSL